MMKQETSWRWPVILSSLLLLEVSKIIVWWNLFCFPFWMITQCCGELLCECFKELTFVFLQGWRAEQVTDTGNCTFWLQQNGNLVLKTPPISTTHHVEFPLCDLELFVSRHDLFVLRWKAARLQTINKPALHKSQKIIQDHMQVMWCILIQGWKLNNKFCLILLDSFHQTKYLTFTVVSLLSWIRCNGTVGTSLYAGGPEFESWLETLVS
jgi:hypothetical protein